MLPGHNKASPKKQQTKLVYQNNFCYIFSTEKVLMLMIYLSVCLLEKYTDQHSSIEELRENKSQLTSNLEERLQEKKVLHDQLENLKSTVLLP